MSAAIDYIGTNEYGRGLYISALASLDDWPSAIAKPEPYFVLFLALDATRVPDSAIRGFADKIAVQGVAYVCTWGPACSRVHDIFDFALYVDNEELRRDADEHDSTIMTSWHEDEGLDEALYFAVFDAHPDDRYFDRCRSLLAVVVDSPSWASEVRHRLENPAALSEDVLAREPEPRSKLARLLRWMGLPKE
jgi:hypothetical protein